MVILDEKAFLWQWGDIYNSIRNLYDSGSFIILKDEVLLT